MRSTAGSRMIVLMMWLAIAAAIPECPAQSDPAQKPDEAGAGWVAAGTITGFDSHIYSLAFGPGSILVSGDARFVRVWNVETKLELPFYKPPLKDATAITAITYSPNDDWVSFRGPNDLHLASGERCIKDGRPVDYGHGTRGDGISPFAIASDGKTYARRSLTGNKDVVDVYLYDFRSNPIQNMRLASCRGHTGPVECAAFAPNRKLLATGSQDKTVRLWDPATGQSLAILAGHTDEVSVVEFSPDGRLLATGGKDGRIQFWDVATRTERGMIQGKTAIRCLSFAPDSKSLAAGDDEGLLRIVNVEAAKTSAVKTDHAGTVFCVAFSRTGDVLASAGQDKQIRLWKKPSR